MDDFKAIVKAVLANPGEQTPVSALADYLTERDDSRGEILRRWLSGERLKGRLQSSSESPYHREQWTEPFDDEFTDDYEVSTAVHPRTKGEAGPTFALGLTMNKTGQHFYVPVGGDDARRVADRLPHAEKVHQFLDNQLGPDTRTEKYSREVDRALRPKNPNH